MTAGGLIAVDVASAGPSPTGVGVYVRDLVTGLLALAPAAIRLIGVRMDGPFGGCDGADAWRPFRGRHNVTWLQRRAAADARAVGATLVHYTNGLAPLRSSQPFVLTIQDLSLMRRPRSHPAHRLVLVPLLIASACRAQTVIVPSRATASELRHWVGVPDRLIVVVEHAPSSRLVAPEGGVQAAVLERYGLTAGRYIVSTGTFEPRKNHNRLVRAFEMLAAEDQELRLVLVGAPGWKSDRLRAMIARSPHSRRIVVPGYLSDPEVASLIAGASVAAYVSLYEGYGLPVVEAMALGVPVVTSTTSALPEAAGGAAVLVDPRSIMAVAAGIRIAQDRRDDLVRAGARRTSSRSWEQVAGETLEVYRWIQGRI